MAIKQYPYQLLVLTIVENGKDEDGNNLPPTENWEFYCNCRDEAGNGKPINNVDGASVVYSFLIQMPEGVEAIPAGTKVMVTDGLPVRCTGSIIYSRKDQFHSRAWV